jgi:protein-S-isoprenylcysteine O-methyltransferase Ste14
MKTTRDIVLAVVLTLAAVGQIVLAFLLYDKAGNTAIINLGWAVLWVSAIFGWLPIFALKKWGEVPKGKSYLQTTILVDRGVYGIVRHPQYLAGMLMGIALPMISQHWAVAVLGIVSVTIYYINTYDEEASNIDKFGDQYREYMKRVPRVNLLLGIYRFLAIKR